MRMKGLLCLTLLFTPLTGVCSQRPQNVHVKTSEMVALQCPASKDDQSGANLVWIHHVGPPMVLSGLSGATQRRMAVLVHGRSLVILNASVSHQGNYSCSMRNASGESWFRLTVDPAQSEQYDETCHVQTPCDLTCPDVHTPAESTYITISHTVWHKVGEQSPMSGPNLESAEKDNEGVYTCTRYYRCHDRLCHMTFTVLLDVKPNEKSTESATIISPQMGERFSVDLGSTVVVACQAVTYSDSDGLFWLIKDAAVDMNQSLPVFQNYTSKSNSGKMKMTASLVFRNVSEADLLHNYTCKLETDSLPRFVTISLQKKPAPLPPCYLSLALTITFPVLFMIFVVIVHAKFKLGIALFLRDTLGCHRSSSDGKTYDAFLMCYQSATDVGLNERDKSFLKRVLEETFGYTLCLIDRDVLPGKAAANAVLDCIEQSRTVVLVPTSTGSCLESGLLSAIHATRVERRSRLVFIQTSAEQRPCSGSVPEALHLLAEAGNRVTWEGSSSMSLSSPFWKQLRYHLPALQDVEKKKNQEVI